MQTAIIQRPAWAIDERLEGLMGCAVRVRVETFTPRRWNGEPHVIDLRKLTLPDGTKVDHDPVHAEGVLRTFTRRVAVVCVELDALPLEGTAEGRVLFRGRPAVILRGPATVQLHGSHFVERVPVEQNRYWNHLSSLDAQMELPFVE